MSIIDMAAIIIGAGLYLLGAVQWAIYLTFWNGFVPLALVWPVLQVWVWSKGDPHKGGF